MIYDRCTCPYYLSSMVWSHRVNKESRRLGNVLSKYQSTREKDASWV